MSREWFVTGTDTGVGKTAVTAALLRRGGAQGLATLGLKPVESGCEASLGEDGRLLRASSSLEVPEADVSAYCLSAPLAPTVAASREGIAIEWEQIVGLVERARRRKADVLLVEGAGGLLVPMTEGLDMAAAAKELGLSLLVVARDSLGTINHTCLTVEAARSRGLVVGGVVLNQVEPGTSEADVLENARQIERLSGARVLGLARQGANGVADLDGVELGHLLR